MAGNLSQGPSAKAHGEDESERPEGADARILENLQNAVPGAARAECVGAISQAVFV